MNYEPYPNPTPTHDTTQRRTNHAHRYYRSPETSLRITILIFFSWFLGFSGVFLLPFDISDVQTYGHSAPWILQAWQLIYWGTFVLTWVRELGTSIGT